MQDRQAHPYIHTHPGLPTWTAGLPHTLLYVCGLKLEKADVVTLARSVRVLGRSIKSGHRNQVNNDRPSDNS
jgi:hypothetical protein